MIRIPGLFILAFLFFPCSAICQEYSYTHYTITDGLAGSVVYCITQDSQGFIWVGTESGVSRFDGTNFKTFSTSDGLPDIEVLEMFGDSKGRVWMSPFRGSICYYYKGRIHNADNDPQLHSIELQGNVESFAEDAAGNILLKEKRRLHLVGANGAVRQIDFIDGHPITQCGAICRSASGHFLVQEADHVYSFSDSGFIPICSISVFDAAAPFITMNAWGYICWSKKYQTTIHSFATGNTTYLPFEQVHYRHLSFAVLDDSLFYFNEIAGAREFNWHTGGTKCFVPNKEVSRSFRDATGNLWFTTLGQGLFRLNSDEFKTVHLSAPDMEPSSVFAIKRIGNSLFVGDNHNYVFELSLPGMTLNRSGSSTGSSKNRVTFIEKLPTGHFILGSDLGFQEGGADFHRLRFRDVGTKFIFKKDADNLLFSSFWGAGNFNLREFRITDTLWRSRTTVLYYRKDTNYIGTLSGLYIAPGSGGVFSPGTKIPFLQKRISAISESPDGTLWIGSYDSGVIGYRNGQVVAAFSKAQGLNSDICRTLLINNGSLWIGTDKGLNRVRLDVPGYPIDSYTSNDGLGSDIINSIYADSAILYVGTPAGLSYFDETRVNRSEGCQLYLLSVINGKKERIGDTTNLILPFADRHFRLEYSGISYRSVGGITYRYRLLGLDTNWQETKASFLDYLTLPSGHYQLELQAKNKFGQKSSLLTLPFEVETPWWQSSWFYALMLLAFFCLTWLFVSFRIRQIRNRQQEKEKLNQRLMEMEHMALQAQMNPHFIFNCLNSIQQYIFDQDIFAANKYISGFSRLIRATLQNSSKPFISLSDEVRYLTDYLSLEKLRFKDKMDYRLDVDVALQNEHYIIPPMLIQPYVENSMRHGLRHMSDGKGLIQLLFRREDQHLSVTVEDNGIGRKQAAAYKTREHIEYQSKGMSLTADRIRMINAKYGDPITVDVVDLEDETGRAAGTRVIMKFPLFHHLISENDNHDKDHFSRR